MPLGGVTSPSTSVSYPTLHFTVLDQLDQFYDPSQLYWTVNLPFLPSFCRRSVSLIRPDLRLRVECRVRLPPPSGT